MKKRIGIDGYKAKIDIVGAWSVKNREILTTLWTLSKFPQVYPWSWHHPCSAVLQVKIHSPCKADADQICKMNQIRTTIVMVSSILAPFD